MESTSQSFDATRARALQSLWCETSSHTGAFVIVTLRGKAAPEDAR